ncbi:MAG: hypothetical protein WDW38_000642 [Sanguina aurantia]
MPSVHQACKLTGQERKASNRRRTKIAELTDGVVPALQSHQFSRGVKLVEQRLKLLAEEGITSPMLMCNAEYDAFQACKYAQKHKDARKWLVLADSHARMAEGDDSLAVKKMTRLLAQPLTAPLSNSR